MNELQAIVNRLAAASGTGGVLATLVGVKGSSYRRPGARFLIAPDGGRVGSISGGCLEEDVSLRARTVAGTGVAELLVYDTTAENDALWGTGLGCHGVVQVLLEKLPERPGWAETVAGNLRAGRRTELAVVWRAPDPALLGTHLAASAAIRGLAAGTSGVFREVVGAPPRLVLFGAGDDSRPLARLAAEAGWAVAVADPRPAYAAPARFPEAAEVFAAPASELAARAAPRPGDFAVIMTHHYAHDVPLLRDLISIPLAYLGLLGSRRRAEKLLGELAASGTAVTAEMKARLHAPAGLDIGGEGPEAVALSIVAEMQATLAGRDGRPLRDRAGPIHGAP
jgi:xanthine/CO dehydrogenase XdhC/CoxF family maturation factor